MNDPHDPVEFFWIWLPGLAGCVWLWIAIARLVSWLEWAGPS
jgi:hypothetical protein